jgi:hypothetical protein
MAYRPQHGSGSPSDGTDEPFSALYRPPDRAFLSQPNDWPIAATQRSQAQRDLLSFALPH